MGRISKRKASLPQMEKAKDKIRYQAGIYTRLSSDQDAGKTESIEVQIEIVKKFVEEFNRLEKTEQIDIKGCYTDIGKTGSNFEREGFLCLLQDIRLGEINCVIVKDLSRFGRNYLEAGNYIEKIFPFLGVRFIAVSDGFDTGKAGNENRQMVSEIKNLINDMYAKDFSAKAKLHLKQRREEGSYVGGPPPYGYRAQWRGKRRVLIPDENTAPVVKLIYETFVRTEKYAAVTNELNRRHINPPGVYRKTKAVFYIPECSALPYKGWDKSTVERILARETYRGTLVQGKTSITARDEKNRVQKPENEWVTAEQVHEPLISPELYQKTSEARRKIQERLDSQKNHTAGYPIEENIFDVVLFCGVCGRKMTRTSYVQEYVDGKKARIDGYLCLNSGQTKVESCPDFNRVTKTELIHLLLPLIRMEFAVLLNKPKHYTEYGSEQIKKAVRKAEERIRESEKKIGCAGAEEGSAYMDYRSGKLSQDAYMSFKIRQEEKLKNLRKQKEAQEKERKNLEKKGDKYLAAIKALVQLKNGKNLTKDMIKIFISRINVYPGKRIEVIFTFTAEEMKKWNI